MHLDYSKVLCDEQNTCPSTVSCVLMCVPMHTFLISLFLAASEHVHPGEWFGEREEFEHTLFSSVGWTLLFSSLDFCLIYFTKTLLLCQVGALGGSSVAGSQSSCLPSTLLRRVPHTHIQCVKTGYFYPAPAGCDASLEGGVITFSREVA